MVTEQGLNSTSPSSVLPYAGTQTNQGIIESSGQFNQCKVTAAQGHDGLSLQRQDFLVENAMDDKPIAKRKTESLWAKFCNAVIRMVKPAALASADAMAASGVGAILGSTIGLIVASVIASPAAIFVGIGIGAAIAFILGYIAMALT